MDLGHLEAYYQGKFLVRVPMISVYIVIYDDAVLSSAAAPLDILTRTNDILQQAGQAPAFSVELVGEQREHSILSRPAQFNCHHTFADIPAGPNGHGLRLIIIPAFASEWTEVKKKNKPLLDWLLLQHQSGAELASLCLGSYFLAEAGILNDKPCTSHWRAAEDMRQRFPHIQLQTDNVVTDRDGIYTGGGAFSSLNLILYLVEKFCGHDIGIEVAKNFSIHRDHISQAHFSTFRGLNQHSDTVVLKAQAFIEANYSQAISIDQIAAHVNMSQRNFIRRFKQATQNTPLEYLQRVKIEAAKKALENNTRSIQTLMETVGYSDIKTFRQVFKRITGVTPQAYRNKYGRTFAGTSR